MGYTTFADQFHAPVITYGPAVMPNRPSFHGQDHVHDVLRGSWQDAPTGDKKKSDDNGGEGVPEGIKQFDPKTPNGAASGDAEDLATVEKPVKPEWDNGFDEDVAKRFGAKRHISLADLGTSLVLDPTKERRRIRQLIVGGHGNKEMLATGSGDGPDVGDTLNLKESNKSSWLPYFNRNKFCGKAEIWILSCNVGNGPIPQLMADQSGSTVYAYTRTAYATEKKPWESERGK
jgi:hypothetical protein